VNFITSSPAPPPDLPCPLRAPLWHEAPYELIPSCVGSHYIMHDETGDRTVTRETYAAKPGGVHKDRPAPERGGPRHIFIS
jgi:hypothetical protein